MEKPIKKGEIGRTTIGTQVLINKNGIAYNINPGIIELWETLDGTRTIKEIADNYSNISNCDKKEIESDLNKILKELKQVGLVE